MGEGPPLQIWRHSPSRTKSNVSLLWRHIRSIVPLLRAGLETSNSLTPDSSSLPRWRGTSSGGFTVASAYRILGESSNISTSSTWDHIWAMKGPCRLNFLLWKLCHNAIAVGKNLQKHQVASNSSCKVCGSMEEDTLHTFRDCPWARQIWTRLLRRQDLQSFCGFSDTAAWVEAGLTTTWGS